MHFLEDLAPGQRFRSTPRGLTQGGIQLLGSTPERASQINVASTTMRLLVDSEFRPSGGMLGAGIEHLHWPTPARPGDMLHVESEVLEVRRSKSSPDRGIAKLRTTTWNAANEPVQVMTSTVFIRARDPNPS